MWISLHFQLIPIFELNLGGVWYIGMRMEMRMKNPFPLLFHLE